MTNRIPRLVGVILTLEAAVTFADDDRPRVMVILDTSRSMTEKPKFVEPTDIDVTYPMSTPGGDYDSTTPVPCLNKFCTAKEVLYSTVPGYVDGQYAHVGLSTYFQYVLTATQPSTEATACTYDVLAPPGQLRQFTSFLDFTGSGATTCPGGPTDKGCGASTRATSFPDGWTAGGSGAHLDGFCATPAGYSRPTDLTSPVSNCAGPDCYLMTKTLATPQTPLQCTVWSAFPVALPHTYSSGTSQCGTASYQTSSGSAIVSGIQVAVSPTATTCSGSVVQESLSPTGSPAITYMSMPMTCQPHATAGCIRNTGGLACTSGAPCGLYLESATPTVTKTDRSWYGLFDDPVVAAANYSGGNPYTFGNRTASTGFRDGLLAGAVVTQASVSCRAVGRYTSGTTNGTFGIPNARNTLDNSAISRGTRVNETPTRTGANFSCTADWPCDVTGVQDTPDPQVWTNAGTVYNISTLPTPTMRVANGPVTNTYTTRMTDPLVTSCAALGPGNPTPAPSGTIWTTPAPTGCGTGLNACTFSAGTLGTANAGASCQNVVAYVSGSPGTCGFNGKAYVLDSSTVVTPITNTVASGSSCATGTFTITSADSGYTGAFDYPATITFVSQTAGTPEFSPYGVDKNAPPSGYSGAPVIEADRGSTTLGPRTASVSNVCVDSSGKVGAGSPGAEIESSDASLCGGPTPCTLVVKGMKQVSATGCGSENSPCNACEYQPKNYKWGRPTTLCTYSGTKYTYTVDKTAKTCSYTRREWQVETLNPSTHTCHYSMGARRYDFNQPSEALCSYWALRTTIEAPQYLYTYQYLTKGTEVLGRAMKSGIANNLCSTTWNPSNTFGLACPEIAACSGLTAVTDELVKSGGPSASMTCRLQYGGAVNPWWIGLAQGRYSNFTSSPGNFDPVATTGRACEASAPPANPDDFKNQTPSFPTPVGFCSSSGTAAVDHLSLVSDWYDPSLTNDISVYDALYPPATYTKTWTNTSRKTQGNSSAGGSAAVTSGAVSPRSVFVPIATDFGGAQGNALRAAFNKCIPPSIAAPNADGSLKGGACISDTFNASAPGYENATDVVWKDMTPLYGSLKSTSEYMLDRWTNDDAFQDCRDYYIILATDGLESTPKGFTLTGNDPNTSVEGLVSSLRNTSAAGPRTRPDIKTFVIGFGEGAAGAGGLNNVAIAGGTNTAYSARSREDLATALNAVFTTITQGTFSRSKPALGTDGTRLYAAQYRRPSRAGPDWSGYLSAYRVSPLDGSLSLAWELSQKLNNPTAQPSRNIAIGLRKNPGNAKEVLPFSASEADVTAQLTSRGDYPATLTSDTLIDFLTEKGHLYANGTTTRSSALAPIVSSNPVVLSKSPYDIDYGGSTADAKKAFASFVKDTASRGTRVLFEGTDGMVHAVIDGSSAPDCLSLGEGAPSCPNGTEDWAYIPGSLALGRQPLPITSRPTLVQSLFTLYLGHWQSNLLNNTVSIADICADASGDAEGCRQEHWRTIAVGTQREGGRGVFAIDVTRNTKPTTQDFLWDFRDHDLGYTYSVPAIGRVLNGTHDRFVTVFGGGKDDPMTVSRVEGRAVWVLEAGTGSLVRKFTNFHQGTTELSIDDEAVARPATYRRPGSPYLDSAYAPIGQSLYALRFNRADGTPHSNPDDWEPEEFFNPLSLTRNTELATCPTTPCGPAKVKKVVVVTPGTATTPPVYGLQDVQDLPLTSAPSILNRPKVSAQLVPNGAQADLFVGTGDITDPKNPVAEFMGNNYFYALHDFNLQTRGSKNDGRALWVVQFAPRADTKPEEIVSEPAIVNGCVVVATYHPPATGGCGLEGDTTLYSFSPIDGSLKACLTYSAPSPYVGLNTPVLSFPGVGIPSDFVVINDNLYMSQSKGGTAHIQLAHVPQAGKVRSYRRLK